MAHHKGVGEKAAQAWVESETKLAALREISMAALATVKAVDFNHETRETPLKYTVPWLEIVALRKAFIAAGIKTEGEYKPRDALGR